MSVDDLKARRTEIRRDRSSVAQLLATAAKDSDAVSVFGTGTCATDSDAAIFVVKGWKNVEYLVQLLQRQGLLTPDKPVEDHHP